MKRFYIIAVAGVVALAVGIAIAMGASSSMGATSKSSGTVSVKGNVLVNAKGLALYTNNKDRRSMPACNGACLSFWKPFIAKKAPADSSIAGKFALVKRGSARQVTFKGRPLYTFVLDKPGQVSGNNAHDAFGGVKFTWHVVHAQVKGSPSTTTSSNTTTTNTTNTNTNTSTTGGGYGY